MRGVIFSVCPAPLRRVADEGDLPALGDAAAKPIAPVPALRSDAFVASATSIAPARDLSRVHAKGTLEGYT